MFPSGVDDKDTRLGEGFGQFFLRACVGQKYNKPQILHLRDAQIHSPRSGTGACSCANLARFCLRVRPTRPRRSTRPFKVREPNPSQRLSVGFLANRESGSPTVYNHQLPVKFTPRGGQRVSESRLLQLADGAVFGKCVCLRLYVSIGLSYNWLRYRRVILIRVIATRSPST